MSQPDAPPTPEPPNCPQCGQSLEAGLDARGRVIYACGQDGQFWIDGMGVLRRCGRLLQFPSIDKHVR
jgi:hypothetical protein